MWCNVGYPGGQRSAHHRLRSARGRRRRADGRSATGSLRGAPAARPRWHGTRLSGRRRDAGKDGRAQAGPVRQRLGLGPAAAARSAGDRIALSSQRGDRVRPGALWRWAVRRHGVRRRAGPRALVGIRQDLGRGPAGPRRGGARPRRRPPAGGMPISQSASSMHSSNWSAFPPTTEWVSGSGALVSSQPPTRPRPRTKREGIRFMSGGMSKRRATEFPRRRGSSPATPRERCRRSGVRRWLVPRSARVHRRGSMSVDRPMLEAPEADDRPMTTWATPRGGAFAGQGTATLQGLARRTQQHRTLHLRGGLRIRRSHRQRDQWRRCRREPALHGPQRPVTYTTPSHAPRPGGLSRSKPSKSSRTCRCCPPGTGWCPCLQWRG